MKTEVARYKQLTPLIPAKTEFSPCLICLSGAFTELKLKQMNDLRALFRFHKGRFFHAIFDSTPVMFAYC